MASLQDKFRGCIAGSWIGSAMGAVVEGWPRERIKERHGYLDKLLPYKHYIEYTDWPRAAGTTEDGIERQRLIATAIIEKQDRIAAHDLVAIWLRDVKASNAVYKQEPFDQSLLQLAAAGVPPVDLGQLWPYPNVISMARVSHPLGLINAGDPAGAADDSFEVGKVYAKQTAFALRWAALYNAAIAEACKPTATVESVLAAAQRFISYRAEAGSLYARYDTIADDVKHALDLAARYSDPMEMRDEFYKRYYGGGYFNYSMSQANEIVAKGLAIFAVTKGDAKLAITTAVNFGRDTDCLAAIAGGLAGTLAGASSLPQDWIAQVNEATKQDPYTNSRRTIEETADGLLAAFVKRCAKMRDYLCMMGQP